MPCVLQAQQHNQFPHCQLHFLARCIRRTFTVCLRMHYPPLQQFKLRCYATVHFSTQLHLCQDEHSYNCELAGLGSANLALLPALGLRESLSEQPLFSDHVIRQLLSGLSVACYFSGTLAFTSP